MGYIYAIFIEDKCLYVGQTKRDPNERWKEHKREIKKGVHKIKGLNKYKDNVDDLEFRVLKELETDNTLLLSVAEMCLNSMHKPLNRCVLQQGYNKVILQRCSKDIAENLLGCIG
ncbi:GIY-YIG nuclease family protein [Clostridium botulinum]|uniref:GIY-YIG nuclease family protein n=1 Tax=Clostridium botulinum TaxID=1491 RepID=UPI001C9A9FF8|nr:GIY-YIG nuclease family protein [Clostridium botulinum]MBY6809020.1 GIY-YIG nuclease family protein [Clostridium botulinum]MBY6822275.1 GIY-YIG nuclease family protein [Clostridium botulinum]MBY6832935.1 GIY-YIG nuclease family protein [Clostridium botulinum]MBY6972163.1 GIY-YIG nuclease family protein [Clostridium botulinum]HBJ1649398.1 GIY-YIG nuclease family protein [Clostridium botulinum]